MCDALKELMKPELEEAMDEDRLTQIKSLSTHLRRSYSEIIDAMQLTEEEKERYRRVLLPSSCSSV